MSILSGKAAPKDISDLKKQHAVVRENVTCKKKQLSRNAEQIVVCEKVFSMLCTIQELSNYPSSYSPCSCILCGKFHSERRRLLCVKPPSLEERELTK